MVLFAEANLHRDLHPRLGPSLAAGPLRLRNPDRDHRLHGIADGHLVNAWINHPGGFHLVNSKAVDVNRLAAVFGDSYLWSELLHMRVAGYMVTGFLVAGAYAFGRLRNSRWSRRERIALTIPADDRRARRPGTGADRGLGRVR